MEPPKKKRKIIDTRNIYYQAWLKLGGPSDTYVLDNCVGTFLYHHCSPRQYYPEVTVYSRVAPRHLDVKIIRGLYTYENCLLARKNCISKVLPGPPHWGGAEGGRLGLPKDVAKMILTWL